MMKYNRWINAIIILLLVVTLMPAQKVALARPTGAEITRDTPFVPGELVVTFAEGQKASAYNAQASAMANAIGATVVDRNGNTALLSASPDADVLQLAGQVAASGQVVAVQPNYIYWAPKAAASPGGTGARFAGYTMKAASGEQETISWDQALALRSIRKVGRKSVATPTFPSEIPEAWGWQSVGADIVWSNAASTSVYVCLLDTGVDVNQPDLKGNVISGYDYVNDDKVPADDNGHGTAVAGVIMGKLNTGTGSAAGVYNGKLVAVKVLNAQGYGTSFSIAAGITYCYKGTYKSPVRVINMSFAGPAGVPAMDLLEYNALYQAVKAGKLLVAAAGNDSTSDYAYPAAWADSTVNPPSTFSCPTGDTFCSDNLPNPVSLGMISVASARAPGEAPIWVETNLHDGLTDGDDVELKSEQCATSDTNYGNWITLVAPGEDIVTSTPTSAPFSMNVTDGVPAGFASFRGTSMAAGFVSGTAARYYTAATTNLSKKNYDVKAALIEKGDYLKLTYYNDVGGNPDWDATKGYNQDSDVGLTYGEVVDTDGDTETLDDDYTYAPFCWPGWDSGFKPANWSEQGNMWNARYINVARAMDRAAVEVFVRDATNGLPLTGATVQAAQKTISVVKDKAVVGSDARVLLINLPLDPYGSYDMPYFLQVNKTGYTVGNQNFNKIEIPLDYAGSTILTTSDLEGAAYNVVSVPPYTNMNAVLDWQNPQDEDGVVTDYPNLDMYLWLPSGKNYVGLTGSGGIIGHDTIPDAERISGQANLPAYLDAMVPALELSNDSLYLGAGTLSAASTWGGSGDSPYAVHNFNGGIESEPDSGSYYAPVESITIKATTALSTTPFAKPYYATSGNVYTIMVTDNSQAEGYLSFADPLVAPVVRFWSKGKLAWDLANGATSANPIPLLIKANECTGGGDWWEVATITGSASPTTSIVASQNTCGEGIDVFTNATSFYGSVVTK